MDEKTNLMRGERVKAALKASGITQRNLAERLHFTPNYISQVIRGKRNLTATMAREIADLTGVRPEYLLGIDDFKTRKEAMQKSVSYLETFDTGIDNLIELVAIVHMNTSLRIERRVPKEQTIDARQELASKSYVFTNNDDSTVKTINGLRIGQFRQELLNYAEFLLRKILQEEQLRQEILNYSHVDSQPGADPIEEE